MDLAVGLSPLVLPRLPALIECVVDEARRLGFEFRPKRAEAPAARQPFDTLRVAEGDGASETTVSVNSGRGQAPGATGNETVSIGQPLDVARLAGMR
jgi:hypothetical protein